MLAERAYDSVHIEMLAAFPELSTAHARFLADWRLSEPPGQYIHLDLLNTLIELTLLRRPSAARDALLSRAFAFVEDLVKSPDADVRDLGYIGVLEWRAGWWHFRVGPFLGSSSRTELDRRDPTWRETANASHGVIPTSDVELALRSDPWGVEQVIESLLGKLNGRADG